MNKKYINLRSKGNLFKFSTPIIYMEIVSKKLIENLSKIKSVNSIILFGSQANGKVRADSDIDLAVISDKISEKEGMKIIGYSNDKTDISLFSRLPIIIQFRVFKEGKVLFCRDEKNLHNIKCETFIKYMDFAPFIERFYKKVLQNVWFAKSWEGYIWYRKIY